MSNAIIKAIGDVERGKIAKALRSAADALSDGAEYVSGCVMVDVEQNDVMFVRSDLRMKYRPRMHPVDALKAYGQAIGLILPPEREAEMRAICDEEVTFRVGMPIEDARRIYASREEGHDSLFISTEHDATKLLLDGYASADLLEALAVLKRAGEL
jgi:hypothetical protein